MSSSSNPESHLTRPVSSSSKHDAQTPSVAEPTTTAETLMDQPSASALIMDSSSASPTSDVTSPTPTNPTDVTPAESDDSALSLGSAHVHPIPPASEPMQYRAIGLVRGQYTPSDEQFTRGTLKTDDGYEFGAVLLGRVMSLVRKHIDLETPHLWVVYPRTRDKDEALHLQIVGVWEPETLSRDGADSSADATSEPEAAAETEASDTSEASAPEVVTPEDGYFSIRGEVLFYSAEEERLIVKIQQAPKKGATMPRAFKLNLKGKLEGKAIGYFWDLKVHREADNLVMHEGTMIALVPPKKKTGAPDARRKKRFGGGKPGPGGPRRPGGGGGGGRRRWEGSPGPSGGDRSAAAPSVRRDTPPPRPVKRPKPSAETE